MATPGPSSTPASPPQRNWLQKLFWPENQADYSAGFSRPQDFHHAITAILNRVDDDAAPFKWRVFWVAALGFLTDSYNLFASNVVLPALAYVYWPTADNKYAAGFNIATLLGSMVGQVVFGITVDIYGRRSLYGIELMIVVVSTFGLLQCSQGYLDVTTGQHTWNITPWLFFWRIIMGIGIGAEYPLSACIAAEWSAKHSRARMMFAVFLMQPLGQILAYIVGIIAISILGDTRADIDKFWRIVIGIGAAPTLLALLARRSIPDTWRFTYFVQKNPGKALFDIKDVYNRASIVSTNANVHGNVHGNDGTAGTEMQPLAHPQNEQTPGDHETNGTTAPPPRAQAQQQPATYTAAQPGSQFKWSEFKVFLWQNRGRLTGTSLTWLLLDFAFYGMGFNSPGTLAKLWTRQDIMFKPDAPWWQTTSDVANTTVPGVGPVVNGTYLDGSIAEGTIGEVLSNTMKHALYTTSIAAALGVIVYICTAHLLNRRKMLIGTFGALTVLMAIAAGVFRVLFHDGAHYTSPAPGGHVGLVLIWIIIQFFFSFGPNTLTFIIPAEVFPTRYRCTCYGIAAAAGKLGAVLVQVVIWRIPNGPNVFESLQWLLVSFSLCMALGCTISLSQTLIPDVQRGFENKTLEELSDDQYMVHRPPKPDDQS